MTWTPSDTEVSAAEKVRGKSQPELCAKCGTRLHDDSALRPARLCPRHLHEARLESGPFACTTADVDAGYPEDPEPERDNLANPSPADRASVLRMFAEEHQRGEHGGNLTIGGCPACARESQPAPLG